MNRRYLVIEDDRDEHVARHNVTLDEAEEVVFSRAFVRRTRERSYTIVGQTLGGRSLMVVIAPRGRGVYGLKTARNASFSERRSFLQWIGRR